ncbi:MAG TPA: metalloregulator ArsR/SmtB family transcription factor [Actinocatenispora sp.]
MTGDVRRDDVRRALAAVAEPTRFRILELLAARPYTVGEVAEAIGALQPQTTKHLQVLAAAGVVRVHKLGRRRVARLDRVALARVGRYFARLAETDPDDAVLDAYESAIRAEATDSGPRVLRFSRTVPASAEAVWTAWTDPAQAVRWWAPRHFTVGAFEIAPRALAPIRVVLREGDSAEYESRGRVEEVERCHRLVFTLAPVDPAGTALLSARHTLTIRGDQPTTVDLLIEVSDVRPEAAPIVAGLEPGWSQLLDALAELLRT